MSIIKASDRRQHLVRPKMKLSRLTLLLLLAAAARVALAALGGDSNQQHTQMLTNEKPATQQQHLATRYQIIANDLAELSDSLELSRRVAGIQQQQQQQQHQQNQHQQQNPQQQQQQQRQLTGALINGNHATYVEPPADFKPIIYDSDASQFYHQQQHNHRQQPTSIDSNRVGLNSEGNFEPTRLKPLDGKSGLSHNLHAAASADDPLLISSDGPIEPAQSSSSSSSSAAAAAAVTEAAAFQASQAAADDADSHHQLKPSIGRWNDWHDMSIEPDLASSDSSPASIIHHPPIRATPASYQTRYYGSLYRGGQERAEQESRPEIGPFFLNELGFPIVRQPVAALNLEQAVVAGRADFQQRQVFAVKRPLIQLLQQPPPSPPATAIKGGQPSSKTATGQQQQQQFVVALNLINSASKQAPQPANQAEPFSLKLAAGARQSATKQVAQKISSKSSSSSSSQSKQFRLKRRRKSKTNAEVRIQQPNLKQVNGLMPIGDHVSRSRYSAPANKQQQQQAHQSRVPEQMLAANSSSAAMLLANQAPASGYQSAKRVIRKRKIKSQLPVGLSSWFLGGIRDLDGRHWRLPNEVISRLAVNDIELAHPNGPAGANQQQPTPSSSVVVIPADNREQFSPNAVADSTGAAVAVTPGTARTPTNQLIPR